MADDFGVLYEKAKSDPTFQAFSPYEKRQALQVLLRRDPTFNNFDEQGQRTAENTILSQYPDPVPDSGKSFTPAPISGYKALHYVGSEAMGREAKAHPGLLGEIDDIAEKNGWQIGITSAYRPVAVNKQVSQSGDRSRHIGYRAVDIGLINGMAVNTPEGKKLGDQLTEELKRRGFSFGEHGDNAGFLWQTNVGGNHFNHIHASLPVGWRKGDATSVAYSAAANMEGQPASGPQPTPTTAVPGAKLGAAVGALAGPGAREAFDIYHADEAAKAVQQNYTPLDKQQSDYLNTWLTKPGSKPYQVFHAMIDPAANPDDDEKALKGFSSVGRAALLTAAKNARNAPGLSEQDYQRGVRAQNMRAAAAEEAAATGTNNMPAMLSDVAHKVVRGVKAGVKAPFTGTFNPNQESGLLLPGLASQEKGAIPALGNLIADVPNLAAQVLALKVSGTGTGSPTTQYEAQMYPDIAKQAIDKIKSGDTGAAFVESALIPILGAMLHGGLSPEHAEWVAQKLGRKKGTLTPPAAQQKVASDIIEEVKNAAVQGQQVQISRAGNVPAGEAGQNLRRGGAGEGAGNQANIQQPTGEGQAVAQTQGETIPNAQPQGITPDPELRAQVDRLKSQIAAQAPKLTPQQLDDAFTTIVRFRQSQAEQSNGRYTAADLLKRVSVGEIGKAVEAAKSAPEVPTGPATWTNNGVDHPVNVTGYAGEQGGRHYVNIEGSNTAVPLDEVSPMKSGPSPAVTAQPPAPSVEARPSATPEAPTPPKHPWQMSAAALRMETAKNEPANLFGEETIEVNRPRERGNVGAGGPEVSGQTVVESASSPDVLFQHGQANPSDRVGTSGRPEYRQKYRIISPDRESEISVTDSPEMVEAAKKAGYHAVPIQDDFAESKASQPKGPGRLFQRDENAPTFFSKAERVVTDKMGARMPADALRKMLLNNGVKPAEMKWSGLDDLLIGKDTVTKAEVLKHLAENNVQVQEVMKGGSAAPMEWKQDSYNKNHWTADTDKRRWSILKTRSGFLLGTGAKEYGPFASMAEAQQEAQSLGGRPSSPAKYSNYQLPGGSNYRELLLTLPDSARQQPFEKWMAEKYPRLASMAEGPVRDKMMEGVRREYDLRAAEGTATPNPQEFYRSPHWDEPNVLAHVRFSDRYVPNGEKILHVEEIQSDWHQAGRKEGYKGQRLDMDKVNVYEYEPDWWVVERTDTDIPQEPIGQGETRESAIADAERNGRGKATTGVPAAPFSKTWHELAAKRVLRYAAEHGYDKVSWTPGEAQNERYDLSKQVSTLRVIRHDNGTFDLGYAPPEGGNIRQLKAGVPDAELPDFIGKELAEKAASDVKPGESKDYSGLDLKVGGEGMKGFYDKILPATFDKLGRQFGAKVGETEIGGGYEVAKNVQNGRWDIVRSDQSEGRDYGSFATKAEADSALAKVGTAVPSIDITPELRRAATSEGFPLFQNEKGQTGPGGTPKAAIQFEDGFRSTIQFMAEKADLSSVIHEFIHDGVDVQRHLAEEIGHPQAIQDYDTLSKFAEATKDANGKWVWTREGHEKVARAGERYMADGTAPTEELKGVFERMREWFKGIYKHIKGSSIDVELTPEVREYFDRMLGKTEESVSAENAPTEAKASVPGRETGVPEEPAPTTEEPHHSNFQPRDEEGKFDGPPQPPHGPDLTSARNATMAQDRELMDLPELPDAQREGWQKSLDNARSSGLDEALHVHTIAEEIKHRPRQLSDEETAGFAIRAQSLKDAHRITLEKIQGENNPGILRDLRFSLKAIEEEFDHITDALKQAGTETGRALASRKLTINRDYSLISVKNRAKGMKAAPLDAKREAQYETMVEKHKGLTKRVTQLEKQVGDKDERIAALEARQATARMEKDVSRESRGSRRGRSNRSDLKTLAKSLGKGREVLHQEAENPNVLYQYGEIDPEDVKTLQDMAKAVISEGTTKAEDIVDRVHKEAVPYLPNIDANEVRDAISGYGKTAEGTKDPVELQFQQATRAMRLITQLEKVKAGEKPAASGFKPQPDSAEVAALRAELNEALKAAGMREPWSMTVPQRQNAKVTRLEASIAEVQRRIRDKDFSGPSKSPGVPPTPSIEAAESALATLRNEYKKLTPQDVLDARRLGIAKKAAVRALENAKQRLATRDFEKKKRSETPLDKELMAVKRERAGVEYEINKMIASEKKPHPLDYINAMQRFSILSGAKSAAKIGIASVERATLDTAESAFGSALGRVPGMQRIAAKAPSEGIGSVRGDVDAFLKAWNAPDMWKKLKGQPSTIDTTYHEITGKSMDVRPTNKALQVLELPGQIHAAIKYPAQRAAWERGMRRRAEYELRQENDLEDPAVQIRVAEGAYADSLRAIFRGDNVITDAWNMGMQYLENKAESPNSSRGTKIGAKALQVAARLEIPIVRVPTNLAIESAMYSPLGLARAAVEIMRKNGIENLTPDQADIVMRATKKGLIGSGLMAAVWFAGNNVQVAEKEGDVKPGMKRGDMLVFGTRIPNLATHHPLIMAMKVAAIGRKTFDATGGGVGGFMNAVGHGGLETAKEIPFARELTRGYNFANEKSLTKHVKEIGRSFIPRDIADYAFPREKKFSEEKRALVAEGRNGQNIRPTLDQWFKEGKIGEKEKERILEELKVDPRLVKFKNMRFEVAVQAYRAAPESDRKVLRSAFRDKLDRWKDDNPSARREEAEKIKRETGLVGSAP